MSFQKNKGTAFESKCCTAFNEKFAGHGGVPRPFIKNAGSGGIFGGQHAVKMVGIADAYKMVGDILPPPDGLFRFVIECKHYKEPPTIKSIIAKKCAEWDKWTAQVESDAIATDKFPMLIIKYNNILEFVFVTEEFMGKKYPVEIPKDKVVLVYKANRALYYGIPFADLLTLDKSFFFNEKK